MPRSVSCHEPATALENVRSPAVHTATWASNSPPVTSVLPSFVKQAHATGPMCRPSCTDSTRLSPMPCSALPTFMTRKEASRNPHDT